MQVSIYSHQSNAGELYRKAVATMVKLGSANGVISEMSASNINYRLQAIQDPDHGLQILLATDGLRALENADLAGQPYADIHLYGLVQRDRPVYRECSNPLLLDLLNEIMQMLSTVANVIDQKYIEGLAPVAMELVTVEVGLPGRAVPVPVLSLTYGNREINIPNDISKSLRPPFVFVEGKHE